MANIKITALGGQDENGKNMYIVEVNDRIFVLDAGLKYPEIDLYGVDAVIPNMDYLIDNIDRVEGIFISHGHEDHIGALPYLLQKVNLRVYGTHFTISLIEEILKNNKMEVNDFRLYRINENKTLKFNDVIVSFYNTTHSLPECVGIAIHTKDGAIVYSPDFNYGIPTEQKYKTSFRKINELANAKHGVLALLTESIGITTTKRITNNSLLEYRFDDFFNFTKGRIIVTAFSSDLIRIQKIINMAIDHDKNIAIIGRKAQKIIDIAISSDYLKIPEGRLINLKYIDDKNKNEFENLVVIVTGSRGEPFHYLNRMSSGQDRLIHINENDKVVLMTPPVPGTEEKAIECRNNLSENNINLSTIGKDILRSAHASSDDLKLLYSFLNPKYVMPIIGEYRHLIEHKKMAVKFGFNEDKVKVFENGTVVNFVDGVFTKETKINTGDILVDGSLVDSVNEDVISERGSLSEEGSVIITLIHNKMTNTIDEDYNIMYKGFVTNDNSDELSEKISEFITKKTKIINFNQIDNDIIIKNLTSEVTKQITRITKKRPLVIIMKIEA